MTLAEAIDAGILRDGSEVYGFSPADMTDEQAAELRSRCFRCAIADGLSENDAEDAAQRAIVWALERNWKLRVPQSFAHLRRIVIKYFRRCRWQPLRKSDGREARRDGWEQTVIDRSELRQPPDPARIVEMSEAVRWNPNARRLANRLGITDAQLTARCYGIGVDD